MTRSSTLAARYGHARAGDQRGAGLLELVVSAGLMALMLGIAAQILGASQQRFARAERGFENASLDLVLARLRHDVRDAQAVIAPTDALWSHDGLVLETVAGDRVRWSLAAGALVRELRPKTGSVLPVQRQTVLRSVATFRCRRLLAPGRPLVDIELVDRTNGQRIGTASPATGVPAPTVLRQRALRLAVRGAGGRSW